MTVATTPTLLAEDKWREAVHEAQCGADYSVCFAWQMVHEYDAINCTEGPRITPHSPNKELIVDVHKSRGLVPEEVLLIPGLFSMRWSLWLMCRRLRTVLPSVAIWDWPKVFADLQETVGQLADLLNEKSHKGRTLGLVTHSFGDWIARQAIAGADKPRIARVVSIAPVVTYVPIADRLNLLTQNTIPELQVMSNAQRAGELLPLDPTIEHLVIWAKWEWFVTRPSDWPSEETVHEAIRGTHMSVVFQPAVWHRVARHLKAGKT